MMKINKRFLLLRAGLLIVILSIAVIAGLTSFITARAITSSRLGFGQKNGITLREGQATPEVDENGEQLPMPSGESLSSNAPTLTAWDGSGRVTILLLGLDYRDWESGTGPARSDTMILLTLDPLTKSAGILSVPRDMWVSIPGFKHGKINTAYYLGDAYKMPGGGPGLAVKTVEEFLGVPINYYARVDFDAFIRFIDELGGIKVDVPEKISIDLLGDGANTIKTLQPGVQVLPGQWALAYARNRHTQEGDFDRARRQQQVIMGIRDRILSLDMLPTLITKAPTLYSQLASGIDTNLSLDEVIKLALLAKDVPQEQIQQGVLGKEYVLFGQSPDGLSILIPIPDKIHLLRDQIFASSSGIGPETPGTLEEQVKTEAATLAVYNGSDATGLGDQTAEMLRAKGVNVTQVSNADEAYSATTVIDHSGNPYVLKYLVETFNIQPGRIQIKFDPSSPVEVELYLGVDWARNNTLP